MPLRPRRSPGEDLRGRFDEGAGGALHLKILKEPTPARGQASTKLPGWRGAARGQARTRPILWPSQRG